MSSSLSIRSTRAFTLIEIMVAMVIFSIMMAALFAAFRTGMRAYTMGTEHASQQQLGRFAVNKLAEDMHNIYYKPESQYNVSRRQQEAQMDANEANLQTASGRDVVDENLPDLGPPIDLSFTGEDSGEIDQLSLVRYMGFSLDETRPLWSLGRITYYVIDGNLYRAIDDITKPETDEDGNVIPKATTPQVDKLAENCVGFNIKYGYYFDEDWLLADSWDSSASQYRNPPQEEDDDIVSTMGPNASDDVVNTGASGALATQVQQQEEQSRADDLPGWVEVTFKFATDMDNPESAQVYRQTIVMNNKYAQETYVPHDEDDELKGARAGSERNRERGRGGSSSKGSRRSGSGSTGGRR